MKVLLSPAKNLREDYNSKLREAPQPHFIADSERLVKKLSKLSAKGISKLMKVSPALGELNHERYQSWSQPLSKETSTEALFLFNGEVYRGLDAPSFNKNDIEAAEERLRILSGLYGLLKPKDLVHPYRLEMGTSFKVTPKVSNLYKFWGDKITDYLLEDMKADEPLVNLASNEYAKAINFNKISQPVISCHFKEKRDNGEIKMIGTFAKLARGYMARYIVQNKLDKAEDLKGFNTEGYKFNKKLSSQDTYTFVR